jgi:hypothetical protein
MDPNSTLAMILNMLSPNQGGTPNPAQTATAQMPTPPPTAQAALGTGMAGNAVNAMQNYNQNLRQY